MNFYYQYEPSGYWWDKAKPYLNLIPVTSPSEVFCNPLLHPAHKADVMRLDILLDRGGVYLDLDVISLKPFSPLLEFDVVLGEERNVGLCNAVILARPRAPFLSRWRNAYCSFDAKEWNSHSVKVPRMLADEAPDEVHIVDHKKFFWPMYWREHLRSFFVEAGSSFCAESYCVHLWESLTWPHIRKLTVKHLLTVDSEFCSLVRQYVSDTMDEPVDVT
ncbi:glycosyltransferase [uncultured Paludibaculum sp.]|uniref:glycosyltransferase n=1 Tax=uncultured Paludibaculum sp. TaxID=1765020 RepID=UPI00374DB7B1